ncbi:MAG: phosphoglycerate kinase [Elusimicrobiota bacterium]
MIKTINDIDVENKKVLVRCDFNVPIENGVIKDNTRIKKALPTIKKLIERKASVILMSHMGRPKGEIIDELSLRPVSSEISRLINREVKFCAHTIGEEAEKMADSLKSKEVMVVENLRFNTGEKTNDDNFSKSLARLGEVFVQDAFGTVHREHASMVGVTKYLPGVAGELLMEEIKYLSKGLNPEHPFVVCLGGAKIETKIGVILNMLDRADSILIGGGMAYTLLKAKGYEIGKSLLDEDNIGTAKEIFNKSEKNKTEILLPTDHIAADDIKQPSNIKEIDNPEIKGDLIGVDIGEDTQNRYIEKIERAKTVVLNGPMGVFEKKEFASGTKKVFESVSRATKKGASTIVGGGDTVSAIKNLDIDMQSFTHVSTGGGASLKFLEGKDLPGIKALE